MAGSHSSFRRIAGAVLLYGLALGLLMAALQMARYRFLLINHAEERYVGLIAALFTSVGIWAGSRIVAGSKSPSPAAEPEPLSGQALDQILAKRSITRREYEILQLIAQGMSNQEIAAHLYVSLNTVKTHTSNLFAKLDAQRRTQAVQKARAIGLLAPAHPKV